MSQTDYADLMPHRSAAHGDPGAVAAHGAAARRIDYVVCGTVIQEVRTSNVAREAALGAGIPEAVPAHTVTMACISSNVAMTTAMGAIAAGQAEVVLVGGTESMSDVPIRFSRNVRKAMIKSQKAKSLFDYVPLLRYGLAAARRRGHRWTIARHAMRSAACTPQGDRPARPEARAAGCGGVQHGRDDGPRRPAAAAFGIAHGAGGRTAPHAHLNRHGVAR